MSRGASGLFVGLDIGTTTSALAFTSALQSPQLMTWDDGAIATPTVLFFPPDQPPLFGAPAYQRQQRSPEWAAHLYKRRIAEAQLLFVPETEAPGPAYTAKDLMRLTMEALLEAYSQRTGQLCEGAIFTVPAYFGDIARRHMREAATQAGWPYLGLLNEPTAAALAYNAVHPPEAGELQVVFDLGGGTLDITILESDPQQLRVLTSLGDPALGGQDWDEAMALHANARFAALHSWEPLDEPLAFEALRRHCKAIKEQLSQRDESIQRFEFEGFAMELQWDRRQLSELTRSLESRCLALLLKALKEAALTPGQIGALLFAGGGCRMPALQQLIRSTLPASRIEQLDPAGVVARGAALYAWQQSQLPKAARTPEAARYLPGQVVKDISAHPLGFLILRKSEPTNRIAIPKDSPLPASVKLSGFTTSRDGQDALDIFLTQSPHPHPPLSSFVEAWRIEGIPRRPAGQVHIELDFEYEESGIIRLRGRELSGPVELTCTQLPLDAAQLAMDIYPPPRDIVLAIDCSASMKGRSILEAKLAARVFTQDLAREDVRFGLVSFGDPGVQLRVSLEQDPMLMRAHIAQLQATGTTPLSAAMEIAYDELQLHRDPERERLLVILTDGHPDQPEAARQQAHRLHQAGVRVLTVGIGSECNADFLSQAICSSPEEYRDIQDPLQLPRVFAQLAAELSGGGGALVKWREPGGTD